MWEKDMGPGVEGPVGVSEKAKRQDIPIRREIKIIKDIIIICRGYNFSSRNEKDIKLK